MRTKKALLKVIVNRKRWYRGQGSDYSCLLLPNNKMCCIGFLARSLGCKPREIRESTTLSTVDTEVSSNFADAHDTSLSSAYYINDDKDIKDNTRERKLITLGKRMGVQFQFIN